MKRIRKIRSKLRDRAKKIYVYRTKWYFIAMLLVLAPFLYVWLTYPSEKDVKVVGTLLILFALLIVFLEASRRLPFYEMGR
ncbi:MAG: hypothetical protein HYW26_04685 [Candidatus Aenigmarchaeota archaeon]|nr:hypothetical protein [Candidatus Aenigmarchaeota archaeon]